MKPTFFALLLLISSSTMCFQSLVKNLKQGDITDVILCWSAFIIWSLWIVLYFVAPEVFASLLVQIL